MDGVAVGMLFEKVKNKSMEEFVIPFDSIEVFDASNSRDRMFLKNKKGREYLRIWIDLDILKDLEKNLRSSAQLIFDESTLMLKKSCIKCIQFFMID